MPAPKTLADAKKKISSTLLNMEGVSGVGLRGDRVVVYLESDDARRRDQAERMAQKVAPATPVIFEVTGRFEKQ